MLRQLRFEGLISNCNQENTLFRHSNNAAFYNDEYFRRNDDSIQHEFD